MKNPNSSLFIPALVGFISLGAYHFMATKREVNPVATERMKNSLSLSKDKLPIKPNSELQSTETNP
jgi:hypothetical protein